MKKLVLVFIFFNIVKINAQDVQFVIPKTAIENSILTLLDARAASFSSYSSGYGVDTYNVKLFYSPSHPLLVNLIPPNRLSIQCGIAAKANIDYAIGNFQISSEGNITLEGEILAIGSQGIINLEGSAETVVNVNGVPGFILDMINANDFTIHLPTFKLTTYILTLPDIPQNYFTSNYPDITIANDNIYLSLTTPTNYLLVDQKDENGNRIAESQIGYWDDLEFLDYTVPAIFNLPINTYQTFRGYQSLLLNPSQKFYNWGLQSDIINHNSFFLDGRITKINSNFKKTYSLISIKNTTDGNITIGGNVQFKDPWYIDYADPDFGNNYRNCGNDAIYRTRTSPFNPNFTTTYENSQTYGGVFLGQNPQFQTGVPVYSVKATSPQTISINGTDRTFYFQNWEASNNGADATFQNANALETPVVFINEGAEVKAVMKASQISNDISGYSKNNQKKTVRTDDGILHMVYESMGKVWYEYSINSGQTWTLGNYGKALNNGASAKNPTIDYMSDKIVIIAYQSTNSVSVEVFDKNYPNCYDPSYGPYTFIDQISYSENVTPVIGISYGQGSVDPINSKILLIYKLNTASLAYQTADLDINSATISNITLAAELPNTSTSSAAPSLAAYKPNTTSKYYHLAYQDGAAVKYKRIVLNGSTLSVDRETTLSTGSGFTNNYNPSITVLSDNSPVVSWVGYRTLRDERLEKANAGTYEERIVLRRGYSSGSWSSVFNKYDDEVNTPSVSSALMGYALGWSSENGSTNKIVRSDYGNQIFTTTQVGRDVQLSNGSSHNNIRFITLNTSALPYAFYNQPLPTDIPLKTSSLAVANGREGIVTKGEAGFYYLIGDVVLDQTTINFTELTDETTIGNETELNSYLTTEEFTINNNSDLTFSVRFGTVDSVTTANTLNDNEYVRFRVELVDAATNELLGTFSSVEYTKTNLYQYNNIGYSVNTEGIGNKKVKIRLRVEDNVEAEYTIAQIIADETVLGKTNYTEISYLGELSVETYELAQNYPNPFNPETVIYYQIPESGEVSLKVYDMLGRELRTLVNQTQNQGRYEVKFNARDLASGVYIYRLQVNDFVTSKKMMLIK